VTAPAAPQPEPDRDDVLDADEVRVQAADRALGRLAGGPAEIPKAGWLQVLKRVWQEAIGDQIQMVAASCAFWAMLALFPTLSVLITLYGLLFDPLEVERQLAALQGWLPAAAYELIWQRAHDLASAEPAKLGFNLVISFLFALWSAMAGTKAMLTALNVAFEEEEKRSFLRFNLEALLFTLGGVVWASVALAAIVGMPAVIRFERLGPIGTLAVPALSFLLLLAFIMLGLAVLYRFGPSRREARWRWVTPGSILAATLGLAISILFSLYVSHFGSYDVMYGSLGAVVVAMMWLWLSAFAVLLGAELNAELELQTRKDTTAGQPKPMGERGAYVADHVATG
jgi:membrane protein